MRPKARLTYSLRDDSRHRVLEGASHFIQSWVRPMSARDIDTAPVRDDMPTWVRLMTARDVDTAVL